MQPIDGAHALPAEARLGEGPLWAHQSGQLYWVDISAGAVHCYELEAARLRTREFATPASALALRASGGLIAATREGFAFLNFERGSLQFIRHPEPTQPELCLNDGRCDRRGRFWAGTYDSRSARPIGGLYRLDPDLSCHKVGSGYVMPNGIGWSPDDRVMYITDSRAGAIYAFDFDIETGTVANRREFARVPPESGRPDGLTVDRDGHVWSAQWLGGCVSRYAPDGRVAGRISLPAPLLTSCTFGGSNLDRLFVTSARWDMDREALAAHPLSGSLFAIETGPLGLPETPFAG